MTNFIKLNIEKEIKIMQMNFKALSGKRFMSMQIIYPISKRSKIGYAQKM